MISTFLSFRKLILIYDHNLNRLKRDISTRGSTVATMYRFKYCVY